MGVNEVADAAVVKRHFREKRSANNRQLQKIEVKKRQSCRLAFWGRQKSSCCLLAN